MNRDRTGYPLWFHVDLDAFYASVEQRDNPTLQGKAVIVGGDRNLRGVVSACSYEARKFGVHSAMPAAEAARLCPEGVFLPVRMDRYQEVSEGIMKLLSTATPAMHQISIDEAFLDMSGTERLLGPAIDQASRLKRLVRNEYGLTASIGIARSRLLAKMASDYRKPDGLYQVDRDEQERFVASLDLKDLWGLGKKTRIRLLQLGIETVQELRAQTESFLRGHLGPSTGTYLYKACRGIDPGIFTSLSRKHSVSTETTFGHDVTDRDAVETVLLQLCEQVMYRCFRANAFGFTVTTKVRSEDFRTSSRQKTLKRRVQSVDELFATARALLSESWDGTPIRLIGVGIVSDTTHVNRDQPDLFGPTDDSDTKKRTVEETVWRLRERLGVDVHKARTLRDAQNSGENT